MFVFFMLWIFFFTWNSSDTFYILKLKKKWSWTMYKITRKYQDVLKNLYILHVLQILYCVFTIHQIDNYDKLCIKYVYYIFTIHPFFYKNSCAFISSIYDIHIIIFSFPSTISCNISFFKSQCKVVFFLFPFSGSLHILLL